MSAREEYSDAAGVLAAAAGAMAFASLLTVYAVLRLRAHAWEVPPGVSPVTSCAGLALLAVAAWASGRSRAASVALGATFLVLQAVALRSVPAAGTGAVIWALSTAHAASVVVALVRGTRGAWWFATIAGGVVAVALWAV